MSGALVSLLSRGAQDLYIAKRLDDTSYRSRYTKFVNFAQEATKLVITGTNVTAGNTNIIKLTRKGDLVSYMWLEGDDLVDNLSGTTFELLIGGQQIDVQTYEYMADIWQVYMAENKTKSDSINNAVSKTNSKFFPLHFYFCDNDMFLPLISLQYHEVEIRIKWGPNIGNVSNLNMYANYVFLDYENRKMLATNKSDYLITQVQRIPYETSNEFNIRYLNHPVKALFFGTEATSSTTAADYWTFDSVDIKLNSNRLISGLTPTYFYTVQVYHHTENGLTAYDETLGTPQYTRYFMYSFGNKVNRMETSGTCNFSRIQNASIVVNGLSNPNNKRFSVYAVNYNVLRVRNGMAGILFSN